MNSVARVVLRWRISNHIRHFYYSSIRKSSNPMTDQFEKQMIKNSKANKELRNDPSVVSPVRSTNKADVGIKKLIRQSKSAHELQSVVFNHKISDVSTYGFAMKHCSEKFNNGRVVINIMESMIEKRMFPHQIEFGIFFNSMAKSDHPEHSEYYLNKMIDEFNIDPNIIIISSLIKGCRKRGDYTLSEYYWNLLDKYQLSPNNFIYAEMMSVYANARHTNAAKKLFNDYKEQVYTGNVQLEIVVLSAYLNAFCSAGDVVGMENALNDIKHCSHEAQTIDIDSNDYITRSIMDGYINARQPEIALKIFDKFITDRRQPNIMMCHLKCVALCQIIRGSHIFESRRAAYNKLIQTIYNDINMYGLHIDSGIINVQLHAAIALFYDEDPMRIVKVFESLDTKYIGYLSSNKKDIDLHLFVPLVAQFILRYVIGFKTNELLSTTRSDSVKIICGQGKGNATKKHSLRTFVQEELCKYKPPIKANIHPSNAGVLIIDKQDLLPYLNKKNFATDKLNMPSKDWNFEDGRKSAHDDV